MHKILLILFSVITASAQTPFFFEPRISGTPLTPSREYVAKYFQELGPSDLHIYQNLNLLQKTANDIGDEKNFIVLNLTNPNSPKFDTKLFVLKKTNSLINVWVEKAELNNNHVTDNVIDDIFNGLINSTPTGSIDPNKGIYEIDVDIFGSPPDFDNNGKVDFLLTDIKDGWEGQGEFIGGFFNKNDQLNELGSNKADILYIDTYPGIYREQNGSVGYHTESVLGTVSHEFQHLLHYGNDPNEKIWVNEGLSEISSFLCGYGLRSPERYLKNTHLQLSSWDNENSIPHYSRVALWTYFLYEKYGLSLISEIAKSTQVDIAGVNAAFNNLGLTENIDDVSRDFFKTVTVNDPVLTPEFSFDWSALQYIISRPTDRAIKYSFQKDTVLAPYSFRTVEFTNGDSLSLSVIGVSSQSLLYNKVGFSDPEVHIDLFSQNPNFVNFGKSYHTLVLYLFNNTSEEQNLQVQAEAKQKYNIKTLQYGSDKPTFLLTSSGNRNAIQFVTDDDITLLKSIEFYNGNGNGDIKFHLFNNSLSSGSNPSSQTILQKNVVNMGWTRLDLEDFQYFRDSGDLINVGLEYLDDGSMGYETVTGSKHRGRSYLKLSNSFSYSKLDEFSIDGGNTNLTGIWMIRIELATPYKESEKIQNVTIGPNPFRAKGSNLLKIRFDGNPAGISVDVYNTIGQLVHSQKAISNIVTWDGKNTFGRAVGSGMYFISFRSKSKTIYKRFVLLR
ncbi:MAG: T9SS C-terminal target domain-containing protein [Calditrichaeota bacterium]|nr:MAG: T9SS C-terminal target domain-containing protein [Calditrichota bacterium]MBL1207554.1 T9SS C-terminal target domain-containing protein [Calditrichota bacterium]NOG47386.1 T9SS type A sorting domain-containing protein [Calditrichota bacterium]